MHSIKSHVGLRGDFKGAWKRKENYDGVKEKVLAAKLELGFWNAGGLFISIYVVYIMYILCM